MSDVNYQTDLKTPFDPEVFDGVEEDEQIKIISTLTDPEEIKAAKEIILEELDETTEKEDTSSTGKEPGEHQEGEIIPGTSEQDKEKKLADEKVAADKIAAEKKAEEGKKNFVLTEEFISTQPEENKGILKKYEGKGKEELAKAAANAIAFKNQYIKDNEEAIKAIAIKLIGYSNEDLLKTLIETQKETGEQTSIKPKMEEKTETDAYSIPKELPALPEDNEELNKYLNAETIARLRKKYPDMPTDTKSPEYKEWLNDLDFESGKEKSYDFIQDKRNIENQVKTEAQKTLYFKQNYIAINNSRLEKEIEIVKNDIKSYGLTEKDLDLDFTLTKDEKGGYYHPKFHNLLYKGDEIDPDIIKYIGDIPLLQRGKLAQKFLDLIKPNLVSTYNKKKTLETQAEIERLKTANLNTLSSSASSSSATKEITTEEIEKTNDLDELHKIQNNLLDSL